MSTLHLLVWQSQFIVRKVHVMFTKVLQHGEMDCDTFEGIKIVEKSAIEMKLLFITGFTRDCYQDLYSSDLHKKYKKWLYHDLNKEIITMSLLLGFYPTSCFPLQTENNFYYFIIIKDAHLCFFFISQQFFLLENSPLRCITWPSSVQQPFTFLRPGWSTLRGNLSVPPAQNHNAQSMFSLPKHKHVTEESHHNFIFHRHTTFLSNMSMGQSDNVPLFVTPMFQTFV